jgi:uncharacterized protein with HEPN domain
VPSSDPAQCFSDILDSIEHIERFTRSLNTAAFAGDEKAVFAVKYALLIISEAAIRLGDIAATLQPNIAWRDVRGIGNHLRHGYDTIDLARIWALVERDLPPLRIAVLEALGKLSGDNASS